MADTYKLLKLQDFFCQWNSQWQHAQEEDMGTPPPLKTAPFPIPSPPPEINAKK